MARDVTATAESAYRPDIDCLRALAIMPALVFHLLTE